MAWKMDQNCSSRGCSPHFVFGWRRRWTYPSKVSPQVLNGPEISWPLNHMSHVIFRVTHSPVDVGITIENASTPFRLFLNLSPNCVLAPYEMNHTVIITLGYEAGLFLTTFVPYLLLTRPYDGHVARIIIKYCDKWTPLLYVLYSMNSRSVYVLEGTKNNFLFLIVTARSLQFQSQQKNIMFCKQRLSLLVVPCL